MSCHVDQTHEREGDNGVLDLHGHHVRACKLVAAYSGPDAITLFPRGNLAEEDVTWLEKKKRKENIPVRRWSRRMLRQAARRPGTVPSPDNERQAPKGIREKCQTRLQCIDALDS